MRQFILNKQHPFLEIVEESENHNQFIRLGLREMLCDGQPFSRMVGGNPVAVGLMPDPEHITQTKMTESFKHRYMDHLVGTTLNEFIRRVMCRQHLANFANLQLFQRDINKVMTNKVSEQALEVFVQMIISGFPFLRASSKSDGESLMVRFDQRGAWKTKDGSELPVLNPGVLEFPYARLSREFDELKADAEGDSAAANEAIKAKMLCSISSVFYRMEFSLPVDESKLVDPNKITVIEKPVSLSDRLKYDLQKAQEQGRVVKR